jgi:hypothetical protein
VQYKKELPIQACHPVGAVTLISISKREIIDTGLPDQKNYLHTLRIWSNDRKNTGVFCHCGARPVPKLTQSKDSIFIRLKRNGEWFLTS